MKKPECFLGMGLNYRKLLNKSNSINHQSMGNLNILWKRVNLDYNS